jgi:hypothetical protein
MPAKIDTRRGPKKSGKAKRDVADSGIFLSEFDFDDDNFDIDEELEAQFLNAEPSQAISRSGARRAIEVLREQMRLREDLLDFDDYDAYDINDEYIN